MSTYGTGLYGAGLYGGLVAAGLPTSIKVEIEVPVLTTAAAFVDVTDYVDMINGIRITQGRANEFEDVQSGSLSLSFFNDTGYFTPDNPSSIYFPGIVEGARIRFSVTRDLTTSVRFFGRIASVEPHFDDGEPSNSRVEVTAVDYFAELARREFKCDFVERWSASARSNQVDLWPFDEGVESPTSLRNALDGLSAAVLPAKGAIGSITMEEPSGIVLDGSLVIDASFGSGPVVVCPVSNVNSGSVVDIVFSFRTTDIYEGTQRYLASGIGSDSSVLWSVRMVESGVTPGQTDISLYDSTGAFVVALYPKFSATAASPADDQWFVIRLNNQGSLFTLCQRTADQTNVTAALLGTAPALQVAAGMLATRFVVLGGYNPSRKTGKQSNCISARFGAVAVASVGAGHNGYLQPNAIEPGQTRLADLAFYAGPLALTINGSLNSSVTLKQISGRTADDCFNEVARTMGGVVFPDYSISSSHRALVFKDSDVMRKTTVALTIDGEADLDGSNGLPLRRATENKPTRVTANWPAGSVTVVGDESVQRLDESVDTCAANEIGARNVASARLNRSIATRITGIRVNLVTASTDLYSAVLALTIGDRVRLSNTPTAKIGYTWYDSYVQGWTETWSQDEVTFEFDPSPADAPVEGIFDDAEYGRFGADGTLAVAYNMDPADTSVFVAPTADDVAVLTTDAAAYPLDLNILGERVTVASVPTTSTRVNRITNPSFETGTTGWATPGGYTAATFTASSVLNGQPGLVTPAGSFALRIVWPNAAAGGSAVGFAASGLTIGQRYTFSVYTFIPGKVYGSLTTGVSPGVTICETSGAGTSVTYGRQTNSERDKWVRLDMSLTASATTHTFGVKTAGASSTSTTDRCYLDAALLEQTTKGLGSYFDGDRGAAWTGTQHASTSSQTVQAISMTRGVAPTLARSHTAGEDVDVWHAAAFAF